MKFSATTKMLMFGNVNGSAEDAICTSSASISERILTYGEPAGTAFQRPEGCEKPLMNIRLNQLKVIRYFNGMRPDSIVFVDKNEVVKE